MRRITKLGLVVAGIAAVAALKSKLGGNSSTEISPINEPVPGDEPVNPEDVPEDSG